MSMSGSSTLSSRTTQAIPARTDTAKRPSTAGDVQPQLSPSESPRRNVASIAEKRIAPGTSTRDCERTGDSGTKRWTRTIETAIAAAPTDEDPAPVDVVDEEAGEHEPEPAADPEDRREQADADLDPLAGELVADDPDAEREHGASRAGDEPRGDQPPDVRRDRAGGAADEEHDQRGDEEPLLPEAVAELAEDRGEDRGREQECRQHPRDPRRRRVEVSLELGQRRHDHRLLERVRRRRERQDPERERRSADVLRSLRPP